MNFRGLFEELRRRNVFKVATAYTIAGWLIIQVFATISPQLGFPEWVAPLVTTLVLIGFLMAIIFAWAFELTPEGVQKSSAVDITESVTASTGKKLNKVILTILGVFVLLLVTERIFFAESTLFEADTASFENASIAVLPFADMSASGDQEYFSDGLSEELLNGLAKLGDIQVAGRTSSFQFKGTNPDLRDVGSTLGVNHILEGSVRKSGNRIRITAQLVQADNGFHLWSETYDRELTANDVFDIQEEITRMVIAELKVQLLPQENIAISAQPTQDIEAYNAFLEATQIETSRRPQDIETAIELYRQAIRIDPFFSLAYSRLAYAYILLYDYGNLSYEETKRLMRSNIDQALLINSNEGKAYQALSTYFNEFEGDFNKSVDAAKKAVELLPNDAMAHNVLSTAYGIDDKDEEQQNITIQKAYKLDPLNNVIAGNYSAYLVRNERFEEALELLDQIIARSPEYKNAYTRKSAILAGLPYGEIGESFKLIYQAYKLDPENRDLLLSVGYRAKDLDFYPLAEYMTKELERLYPDNAATLDQQFDLKRAAADFKSAESLALQIKDIYGGERSLFYYTVLYHVQGRYEEALTLIQELYPGLALDPPIVDESNAAWAGSRAGLLRGLGRYDEADQFALTYCDYLESNPSGTGSEMAKKFDELSCSSASGQYKRVLQIVEDLYFNDNWKSGWPEGLATTTHPPEFRNMKEYKELVSRVYTDLHEMRADVIEWLKAEGEWQEEWVVENNIN
jgi:TolB-like protein/Tfp pilus assembly protein PilF